MEDLISRQALCEYALNQKDKSVTPNDIMRFPSAQPEYNMNEWCTDCKEYDQEHHCCPRFNRVIRETVDEVKANQWIPCTERLPDTDDHVLVTTINKRGDRRVVRAYYYRSDDYPGGGAWAAGMNNNVIAWMPLPEPYREGEKS